MSIPAAIAADVSILNAAFDAAQPLASAAPLVYAGVRDKARDLVSTLDAAIVDGSAALDRFALPATITSVPAALTALHAQCADQADLCALRALIGRVRTNINLAQV